MPIALTTVPTTQAQVLTHITYHLKYLLWCWLPIAICFNENYVSIEGQCLKRLIYKQRWLFLITWIDMNVVKPLNLMRLDLVRTIHEF